MPGIGTRKFRLLLIALLGCASVLTSSWLYAQWIGFAMAGRPGMSGYRPPAGRPGWGWGWGWGGGGWGGRSAFRGGWGASHHSSGGGASSTWNDLNRTVTTMDRSKVFVGSSSNTSTRISLAPLQSAPTLSSGKKYDAPYHANYNGYWLRGYWGGGQFGWARWVGPEGHWAIARWILGPMYFSSGYGIYENPYYVVPKTPVPEFLDYSRPLGYIADDEPPSTSTARSEQPDNNESPEKAGETYDQILEYRTRSPEVRASLKALDAATEAFQAGRYDDALKLSEAAIEAMPDDPGLHQFRALVQFAREDYQGAAATLYAVLSISPGWNWTTQSGLYGDTAEFNQQLKKLEAYHQKHPESGAAAFLRAYHYMTCRHSKAAVKQWENVVKAFPGNPLFSQMLGLAQGCLKEDEIDEGKAPTQTADADTAVADVSNRPSADSPPVQLEIGSWRAQQGKFATVDLEIRKNDEFVWKATFPDGGSHVIAGHYGQKGNTLFLGGGSGALVGTLQSRPEGGFTFSILGNKRGEPPLAFTQISGK
ncbi:MAG: tetratricopeptide repeat protein [Planctomycetes bacterium]|nr:tetratricopeptide repeat protein [Planctomycetota bacterium]